MNFYLSPAQLQRRRLIFRIKLYILFFLLSLIVLGLFYFLNNSDFWRIKKFEILGNKRLSADQIISNLRPMILTGFAGRFLGFDHYLSWMGHKNIYLTSPNFANLTVSADLLKKEIKINVEEREPYGIWCQKTQIIADNTQINADTISENLREPALDQRESALMDCWWFDKEGIALEVAPYPEGVLIFRITDLSDTPTPVVLGKKILDEKYFKYLKIILESVKDSGLSVESFTFDKNLQEITVNVIDGAKILFSLRFDPGSNISALKLLKEKGGLENIEYIDLRVENRIYVKNR